MIPPLRVYCLGEFDIRSQDEPNTSLPKPATLKSQSLLIYLVWHRDRTHARDRIAGMFWGDNTDRKARRSLSTSLWHIRRCLPEGDYLLTDSDTVQFNPEVRLWIDAEVFASLAVETEITSLQSAVELYHAPFMDGFYDDWIINERYRLQALFIETLARLTVSYEREGDLEGALATAQRLIEYEPLAEEAHRAAMRAYHRLGQRNAALVQYETCRAILAEELNVAPAEKTTALYESIRTAQPVQPANFPSPSTPLVDRLSELADIDGLLSRPDCRLLTVVGPGGIGKSRLVIEAAHAKGPDFLDGIYFVPLTDVSADDFLIPAIADALDFSFYGRSPPRHQLLNYLRQKELLLVLDNFEHLVTATDLLTDILQEAPRVKLLVTSRVRLNLHEEWLLEVRGMDFPLRTTTSAAAIETTGKAETLQLDAYSAVQLFVQSARRVRRSFALSQENGPFVARICQLVEGMPLGIELAAAWVRVLSCQEIAREIERNLAFLTTTATNVPERHRNLEAVCRHSWDLLSEAEKQAFKKLTVFRDGFRRPAAEAVADVSLHVLAALADKSLMRLGAGGCYQTHELLRQFAAAKLGESPGTATQTRERHCQYFMAFLQQRLTDLEGQRQKEALAEIRAEIENIRSAWRWALAHNKLDALTDSLKCLSSFYDWQGWFEEGEEALGRAVTALEKAGSLAGERQPTRQSQLGIALARQGMFCFRLAQYDRAKELLRRSITVCRNHQLDGEVAYAQNVLGNVAYILEQYQEAQRYFEESLVTNSDLGNRYGVARCLNGKGLVAIGLEEYEEATRLFEKSRHLFDQIGAQRGAAVVLNNLGLVALNRERYAEAERHYEDGLALSREIDDRYNIATCLDNIGFVAYLRGQLVRSQEHCQQSLRLHREIGNRWGEALSLLHLGLASREMGDYAVARQHYRDSRLLSAEIGARWIEAYALTNLGDLTLATGDGAESRRLCQESVAAFKDIGHTHGVVFSLVTLGQIEEHLGESARAEQLYQEGLRLSQSHNYKFGLALSQRNLGGVARARGELEKARQLLQSSYAISREIGSGISVAVTLCHLADTADAQREPQEAIQLYRQGLERAMAMGAVPVALLAMVGTAAVWSRRSSDEKEQAAEIAAFVLHHVASERQTRQRARQLLTELASELPPQIITAARIGGKKGELATIVDMFSL